MKSKPVKGSARTKRFDVGGTVGALAGLGTLAYLMSRKKKGEAGKEFGPQGKFPQEDGGGTSGPGMADTTPKVDEAAKRRAMAASAGRPEMGDGDKAVMESDVGAKRVGTTPVAKKTAPVAKKTTTPAPKKTTAPSTSTATSTTRTDDVIGAGVRTAEAKAKSDAAKKEAGLAEARKKAQAEADAKKQRPKFTTPGDPNKKEATSKAGIVFGGSTVRTPAQKMAERAREVQRRREEAEKSRYKKGGTVKKYAEGGVTKSKPAPKKPLPANLQREKDNQDQDRRNRKEREEFDKGAPTRLKDQGSMFKSGGMTASKRGDGIAMRGKTKGKMY